MIPFHRCVYQKRFTGTKQPRQRHDSHPRPGQIHRYQPLSRNTHTPLNGTPSSVPAFLRQPVSHGTTADAHEVHHGACAGETAGDIGSLSNPYLAGDLGRQTSGKTSHGVQPAAISGNQADLFTRHASVLQILDDLRRIRAWATESSELMNYTDSFSPVIARVFRSAADTRTASAAIDAIAYAAIAGIGSLVTIPPATRAPILAVLAPIVQ